MKNYFSALLMIVSFNVFAAPKVLIFSKTAGFHHESIPVGIAAITKMGNAHEFTVDTTTDATKFNEANLKQYACIIFLNTTGDVLNNEQQTAFENYIGSGGGFAGVHSATDTEYDWAWYGDLVGAYFGGHPAQQTAVIKVIDNNTTATKHLPAEWKRKDEWYNFKWMTKEPVNILLAIDEKTYDAGKEKMGANHPMAWYHDYKGGRAFYTGLGHTDESYNEPLYLDHLLAGIEYAMGRKKMK